MSSRRETANKVILGVLRDAIRGALRASPAEAGPVELARAVPFPEKEVSAAYPWHERKYSPYKVWLSAVKEWRAAWAKGYRPGVSDAQH